MELLTRLPRATPVGPLQGLWSSTTVDGERLLVHRRFHRDVAIAEAEPVGPEH